MEDEQQNDKTEIADNMKVKEGAAGAKLLLEGEQSNKTDNVEVREIEQQEKVENIENNNVGEEVEKSKTENIENIEIKEVEQQDKTTNAEKMIVKEGEENSKTENLENIEVEEDHTDKTGDENDKTENVESIEIKEEEQKNKEDNKENVEVSEGGQKNTTDNVENNDAIEDQKDRIEIKENTEVKEEEVQKDKTEITENIKSTEEAEQGDKTNIEVTESDKTNIEVTESDKTHIEVTEGDKTNIEVTEGDKTNIEVTESDKTHIEVTEGDKTNIEVTEGDKTHIEVTEGDKTHIEVTEGSLTDKLGRKLYTKQWKGSSPVLGCVFLCHGYAERCTPYYDGVAEECVKRGLLAFSHDHVGHGKSEGSRVQVDSMDWYVQPVMDNINKVKEQYPELPFFIVGHSMGGLITMLTAMEQEDLVRGLVLMGPLVEPDPKMATPTKVWLAKTFSKIIPNFSMSGINSKDVTSDEEWVKKKKEDPDHYHSGFKARHSYVLLKALANLDFTKLKTPFFILHGAEDKICAPAGSKKLYENAAAGDKSMEMVENGLHNLFIEKEPIKSNSMKLCFDWIEARLGKKEGELNNTTDNVEVREIKEKETIEITENNLVGEVEENSKTENLENIEVKEEDHKD